METNDDNKAAPSVDVTRLVRPWMFWVKKPDCTVIKITATEHEEMKRMKKCWIDEGFREITPDKYSWMRNRWKSRLYRANVKSTQRH